MSNSLDPDQARYSVRPDLGPICLQTTPGGKELNSTLCMWTGILYKVSREIRCFTTIVTCYVQ